MLETLQICQNYHNYISIPTDKCAVVLQFGPKTSSLRFLSLAYCELNGLATRLLVDFLQLSHCKLHELALYDCRITFNEDTYRLRLKIKTTENISLNIAGSPLAISHMLAQLQFYASKLTKLIIKIECWYLTDSGTFDIVTSNYSALETLQFIGDKSTILSSSCLNFSSQPNVLNTLSIKGCKLSSEATSTLIHSLRSPHCVLSQMMLDQCDIFDSEKTLLGAAIFSCSTIKHYMYGGRYFGYSVPLTEMISGIKHNQTIKELTIKNVWCSSPSTDDQIKTLVEAIDGSAVKNLSLEKSYSTRLQFSRDIDIVFYSSDNDPFDMRFYPFKVRSCILL